MSILPQLEHDLRQAAEQRLPAADAADGTEEHSRRSGRGGGVRRGMSSIAAAVPVLLAVAVTAIIAGFALTQLHRGRPSPPATPAVGVDAERQHLIHILGVLRRPQTKADLDRELGPSDLLLASIVARRQHRVPSALRRRLEQLGDPKLDRSLVRTVALPAWHAKVGIDPQTWRPSASSPQRSEGLDLEMWIGTRSTIPPSSDVGTGPRPTSIQSFQNHGLALAAKPNGQNRIYGAVLVPDGVARITLRPIRLSRNPLSIDPSRYGTATGIVHDNIATFQLPIPTATGPHLGTGELAIAGVARATWFDTNGTVIKRTTTELDLIIKVLRAKGP